MGDLLGRATVRRLLLVIFVLCVTINITEPHRPEIDMTYLARAYKIAKELEAAGKSDAAKMAWQAHGFFDTAADFRLIRNQHPVAKSAHGKGKRLLAKAEACL